MVALKGTHITSVSIAEAIGTTKYVDPKGELVEAGRALGVEFGG
jgi:hypothetical protein